MPRARITLNEHQQRHLYFGLLQVDKLLTSMEDIATAASSRTLFPRYLDDLNVAQRKLLEGSVARLRATLAELLASQGLKPDRPAIPASGAIRTNLVFAEIAAEELGPSNMRGYGELSAEQSREVEGVVSELRGRIEALLREMSPEPEAALAAQIAALPPNPAQRVMAELEAVTRSAGLHQFRPGLRLLAKRMAAPVMEVAVFGRVSCGKSSLLNYLLGAEILPTGATPITAVPTRVGYGAEPGITARLERETRNYPVGALAELASERHNPDNRLGITELTVSYPSPRLQPGVIFVDTPGLGSIRSWGAMETLAYLPRSDMAMLLVDAGSTLGSEEAELVRWLDRGGVPVQILLSKSDLVGEPELAESLHFTREYLERELQSALPVRAVSVRRQEMAEAWYREDVLTLYARLRERFAYSIERRLAVLRDGIVAASSGGLEPGAGADREKLEELERELRRAVAAADRTQDGIRDLTDDLNAAADAIRDEVAEALAEGWQAPARPSPEQLGTIGGEALGRAMVAHTRGVIEALAQLGETFTAVLARANEVFPGLDSGAASATFAARDLPMPEMGPLPFSLTAPPLAFLGAGRVRANFRRQLAEHEDGWSAALRAYSILLKQRAAAVLTGMRMQFEAHADIYRAALQRATGALTAPGQAGTENEPGPRLELAATWQPAGAMHEDGA